MKYQVSRLRVLHFLAGASLLTVASLASAQTAGQSTATANSAPEGGSLEDIVVTAQKREQNLQDVPIAITALTAERIDRLGVEDSRDLSGLAPNLTVTQGTTSNSAAVFSLRGISNGGSESFGLDNANGLYIDGIYIGRSGAAALDVMDIERVEVLRGPQGTLFGRNTTGGAVAFISRRPSETFRARAEVGYGNYNAWNARVTVDPGEIAGIATSFTYSRRQRHGTYDNLLEPRDSRDPGANRNEAARFAARAEIGGTGSIQYIFDWSRVRGYTSPFQLTNLSDGTRAPVFVDGQPVPYSRPAPTQQFMNTVTFLNPECAALAGATREWRHDVCQSPSSSAKDQSWGHNLQVENDFGAFRVKTITGFRVWHSDATADLDGMGPFRSSAFTQASLLNGLPANLLTPIVGAATAGYLSTQTVPTTTQGFYNTYNERRHRQFTQEIEVGGDTPNLDWVVGGFYFWEKGSENGVQTSGYVLDTNNLFLANFGALGPALAAANPARYRMVVTPAPLIYTATNESAALYAQGTYYFGGRDGNLRLTLGGRYTWDNKALMRQQNGALPPRFPEYGQGSFSKFTWSAMLGYDFSDDISSYARVATGYRSGGMNSQDPLDSDTLRLPAFGPESVTSYEIGLKTTLFDRRLRVNVAGFHNVYNDLMTYLPVVDAAPGTYLTRVGNAGKVTYTGVEVEAQAILTPNINLEGNLGYIDIKYKELMFGNLDPNKPDVNIASIQHPAYTSPLTANAAINIQFPLGDNGMRLVGRASYTYEDGKYSFGNYISQPLNDILRGDNRNLFDAQIGVDRIPFGPAQGEIRFWIKNITNEHDFVRAIDFSSLGYGGGFYGEPRTYGVSLIASF